MGLTKKEFERIESLFIKAVSAGKSHVTDKYKHTERRLYAYPVLKKNIIRYRLDIEDIKKEDMCKSKDFVIFIKNSGSIDKPTVEELREAKILTIEQKIARDEKEIAEINAALLEIKTDPYFKIIKLRYFDGVKEDDIAVELNCEKTTIYRNRKRLINTINVSLYGADALQ